MKAIAPDGSGIESFRTTNRWRGRARQGAKVAIAHPEGASPPDRAKKWYTSGWGSTMGYL